MNYFLSIFLLGLSFVVFSVITEKRFIPSLENIARLLKVAPTIVALTIIAGGSSVQESLAILVFSVGKQMSHFWNIKFIDMPGRLGNKDNRHLNSTSIRSLS